MQQLTALRPLVTAGAAAVGASLIALTPAISNDLASDPQHSAVSIQYREVALTDNVVNPISTWIDALSSAALNGRTLLQQWGEIPFVVPQQIAANWVQFASDYVGAYQNAATAAVNYFTGNSAYDFVPLMQQAWADITSGNIAQAFAYGGPLGLALLTEPSLKILQPLESIPNILAYVTTDLANATNYLVGPGIGTLLAAVGESAALNLGGSTLAGIGTGLQAVYDSATAGDPVEALLNLANFPGVVTDAFLNGIHGGLLLPPNNGNGGLVSTFINGFRTLATKMVAPKAQNIGEGGSLLVAVQDFVNQLINGWPSLAPLFDGGAGGAAAAFAPSIAADIGGIAPSVAAEIGGLTPSITTNIAGTLAPELGTLAVHILTSLF
ncbi:hypothetical protein K3U93_05605 [Mycobacterium malmoense]|uniref:PE-PGRS family protein n=1 Tax=Mycobacterium malmoense TaxID=1780 RepID=A0ABX3SK13_MYCMA|nr:hypothetical protein [Mycobacterium malmoense]OIN79119.1 hypothetical protein BMG05_19680 [Mycobacterium malmoense]ORA77025.1 hypothetical protein BST29_24185 [Mycobacterium malmoense]QZA18664.1 hypothetical protein K3U93_05605 [Mycobacterium malmoense]UNB95437.1 hypothetical protein H5T25_05600 [Mycobacterium malmoense]